MNIALKPYLESYKIHKSIKRKKKLWTMKSRVMNSPSDGSIKQIYLEIQNKNKNKN